ncbi:MAG: alcohol dehydrogenase catalytic domain-containing protein [Acidobacteria bacterium]|nr:alcohol dehydrogenase catalytic domain-containing protein [Acidobacteriota bacterium]MBI3280987.1 alcohol dehydrogenase catalytic domain-containing protein [Acidobacteriota bacterium]
MRVAELYDFRKFRHTEVPLAAPGPGEVQVRVRAVGICGSDLHYFSEGRIGDTPCAYPMVLGHEPTGEVVRSGAQVSGWSAGDKAILEPAIYCYHCEFCRSGRHNLCENLRFLSTSGDPGFFREYVNLPAPNLLPMPAELSFEQNTLFEPLAVALHSMQFGLPKLGETAAVFGAGPIGLLTVALLQLTGVRRIWCIDPVERRRELAGALGAAALIDPAAVDPVTQILADTGRRGVDVVFDCAAKDNTINQAMQVARPAGRVVITGIPGDAQVRFDYHTLRRKELYFYSVRRSNHETESALQLMRQYPERFAPLVTHVRPLEHIGPTFETLARYEDGMAKVVITP